MTRPHGSERRIHASLALAVALLAGCAGSLPEGWLYTTRITTDGATIVWTGRGTGVRCEDPDGRVVEATASGDDLRRARLTGLAPATTYRCRLAEAPMRQLRVRTVPSAGRRLRLAVVGDSGDASREARAIARRVLAGHPDAIVHLGDLAYDHCQADELDRAFFRPYRRLLERVPVYPALGNHDLHRTGVCRRVFAPVADVDDEAGPRYAVAWPSALLVGVASPTITGVPAGRDWVAGALAEALPGAWKIVSLHEPIYIPEVRKFSTRGLRTILGPVLEEAHVDVVLAGHLHLYARSQPACVHVGTARVRNVISGGAGRALDRAGRPHPSFPVVQAVPHYVRIDVTPEELRLRAIGLDGGTIDRLRLRRGASTSCRTGSWPAAWEKDR